MLELITSELTMSIRRSFTLPLAALALVACSTEDPDSDMFSMTGVSTSLDTGMRATDSHAQDAGTDADSGGGQDNGDPDSGDSGVPKLDVLPSDTGVDDGGAPGQGCDYVDLLFVIDNSKSMDVYQEALGLAFPQFAHTLAAALPPGTNVHVAVTSSEMGHAGSGSTSEFNGECTFTGDGMPSDNFYITPDQENTGTNGAQGRLFDPGNGTYYFEFDTDDVAAVAKLESWFASASAIGTGGSNIEMTSAPAGWAVDPSNSATNAGFLRDAGAVLLVFFMTDEPDQTPQVIDNMPGGLAMLDKVAAAKAGCGGLDCVLGGGFLLETACNAQGNLPLDDFLQGLPEAAAVAPLPSEKLPPAQAASEMNALLADTLADVIAAKCDEIAPVG